MTMVCNVAPSGSSPISPAVIALIAFSSGSEGQEAAGVVCNGVTVSEIESGSGVRIAMIEVEEASPLRGE